MKTRTNATRTAKGIKLGATLRQIQARNAGQPQESTEDRNARLVSKMALSAKLRQARA